MDAGALVAPLVERVTGLRLRRLDLARPAASLGEQLATANLGLVKVAGADRFSWPGHWIAIVETETGERFAAVMFGVPSGPLEAADAAALDRGRIVEGYLIAPLDLDRPHGSAAYDGAAGAGVVTAIFTAPASGAPCTAHESRRALAGAGLEGDRYATGRGEFSAPGRSGQALTLIAEESIAAARANGARIDVATARRNIVTRGIALEPLIGRRFTVGGVTCLATRLAEPCAHLERLTHPGVLRAMVHLGGIRADVLAGGEIRVGDVVGPVEEEHTGPSSAA